MRYPKKYFDTHIYIETIDEARRRKKNYAPPFYFMEERKNGNNATEC